MASSIDSPDQQGYHRYMAENNIRVTVWNEYTDDQKGPEVAAVYPDGMHKTIADFLNRDGDIFAGVSVLADNEQGLSEQVLENTDVLIWWAHCHHGDVQDYLAKRVINHVQRGMGIIFLHSAHQSKPFIGLLGSSGRLGWREANEKSRIWNVSPAHPIARDIPQHFLLDREEMYSEPFGIPEPDTTVFISWFEGGNVFRSGVTFHREFGKIFYFQPGHETFPIYHNPMVQKVITNAVKWAKPKIRVNSLDCPQMEALEKIGSSR
jgi:trehalose utilization protein